MNPWIKHVKAYQAKHPNQSYKECLVNAKKTYEKRGGGFLDFLRPIPPPSGNVKDLITLDARDRKFKDGLASTLFIPAIKKSVGL